MAIQGERNRDHQSRAVRHRSDLQDSSSRNVDEEIFEKYIIHIDKIIFHKISEIFDLFHYEVAIAIFTDSNHNCRFSTAIEE